MQKKDMYDYGFGSVWQDVYVNHREGYSTSVTNYHEHGFYEINLILSGNVKILLGDRSEEGCEPRIVLTRPGTPHYISCKPDTLYSRLYLVFTGEFIEGRVLEWQELARLFGERGAVITLTDGEATYLKTLIEQIEKEPSLLSKRLLTYYLLSRLLGLRGSEKFSNQIPPYILEAISYLENHCSDKIVAADLAKRLHIGRTALLVEFKRHTGRTLGEYLDHCRLRKATALLTEGKKLEYTANQCGYADTGGLIRCFKRYYGTTPLQYIKSGRG